MKAEARWGIYLPGGDFEDAAQKLERSTRQPSAGTSSDSDSRAPEVLLVDQRGRPILVRSPRRVGFRQP